MGEVAMDKTLQSESLDEILRSSCTHAEISMKRRQPLQAEPLSQQFHLQWQPQVLSCAGEGILETINMHYYRFPRVNQEGFEGPPSFTSRVLIASWVSSSETGAPTVECRHQQAHKKLLVPAGAHRSQVSCRAKPGKGNDLNIVAAVGTRASKRIDEIHQNSVVKKRFIKLSWGIRLLIKNQWCLHMFSVVPLPDDEVGTSKTLRASPSRVDPLKDTPGSKTIHYSTVMLARKMFQKQWNNWLNTSTSETISSEISVKQWLKSSDHLHLG